MYLLLRSAWEMREHVRWADVIAAAGIGRDERIAAQRRAIEKAVEGTIRPLPTDDADEWPDRPSEATDPTT
jgi:hypothetical protein